MNPLVIVATRPPEVRTPSLALFHKHLLGVFTIDMTPLNCRHPGEDERSGYTCIVCLVVPCYNSNRNIAAVIALFRRVS